MELRHRISIGRYAAGENEWGDPAPATWDNVATVWAAVEGLGGRLYFEAQQTDQQSDHKITIRWRRGIEPGMTVRHDGREYTIQAVADKEGHRRWLELICREVKPA